MLKQFPVDSLTDDGKMDVKSAPSAHTCSSWLKSAFTTACSKSQRKSRSSAQVRIT